jgi:hypothetical protein
VHRGSTRIPHAGSIPADVVHFSFKWEMILTQRVTYNLRQLQAYDLEISLTDLTDCLTCT